MSAYKTGPLTAAQTSIGVLEENVDGIGVRWHDAWGDVQKAIVDATAKLTTTTTGSTPTIVRSLTSGYAFDVATPATEYAGINSQVLGELVKFEAGKPFKAYGSFSCSDATKSDFLFGLCATKTDILNTGSSHAVNSSVEGVFFFKATDSTTIAAKVYLAGTQTGTANIGTMDTLQHEYEIDWDGTVLSFYFDEVLVASFTSGLPTVDLTLTWNLRAGAAAAKTFTIYYPDPRVIQARS